MRFVNGKLDNLTYLLLPSKSLIVMNDELNNSEVIINDLIHNLLKN